MTTIPASLATVVTPVLAKIAIPLGTVVGPQLLGSTHSFASPALPPTQVAFCASAGVAAGARRAIDNAQDERIAEGMGTRRLPRMEPPQLFAKVDSILTCRLQQRTRAFV